MLRKANPVKIEHLKTHFNHLGTRTLRTKDTELMKKALKSLYDLYYGKPNYFIHEDIDNVTIRRMLDSAMNRFIERRCRDYTETHIDKMPLNDRYIPYFIESIEGEYQPPKKLEK